MECVIDHFLDFWKTTDSEIHLHYDGWHELISGSIPSIFLCVGMYVLQIYGYRTSLWAEHLGTIENCFMRPESLECVRKVRSMGEMNWQQFAADEVTEMRAHLLKYPVDVDRKGKVSPLPGCENFPDVGGRIVGSFLAIQENLTIWSLLISSYSSCKLMWSW